jgi:hypothetical protein
VDNYEEIEREAARDSLAEVLYESFGVGPAKAEKLAALIAALVEGG